VVLFDVHKEQIRRVGVYNGIYLCIQQDVEQNKNLIYLLPFAKINRKWRGERDFCETKYISVLYV
jgi:hypothetical protein